MRRNARRLKLMLLTSLFLCGSVQCAFAGADGGSQSSVTGVGKAEHTVYANLGFSLMTSKFYIPYGSEGHPKRGFDWQVGYEWVSKKGIGVGLLYSGYASSYFYYYDSNILLTYVAPQFVLKQHIGRWTIEEKLGLGYFRYNESIDIDEASLSGLGYNFLFGAEYRFSKSWGIGANIGYIGSSLPEQESVELDESEHSGIGRMHFDVGVRFHF